MTADKTFTDDDIAAGPVLGPEYRASQRFAEGIMRGYQEEHLEPLVMMVTDHFTDKLWDVARDWLLADTETNVAGAVREMVTGTIEALLTGKELNDEQIARIVGWSAKRVSDVRARYVDEARVVVSLVERLSA